MKPNVHRFDWDRSAKEFCCVSIEHMPIDLKALTESVHSLIASKSGIKYMELWKIGLAIISFICSSLTAGFIAILYKMHVVGIIFLVLAPFTSYVFMSISASQKRRLSLIQNFLDNNSKHFESQAAKIGYIVYFRVETIEVGPPSNSLHRVCCNEKECITMTIEYAAKGSLKQATKAFQTQEDSHSATKHALATLTKPQTVVDTPMAETDRVIHQPDQDGDSKDGSSKTKRKSESAEEDDLVSDRKLLVGSRGSPDKSLHDRMKPVGIVTHHHMIKDISKRSASHGVFVVSTVKPATEFVKVRPKQLGFGNKPSFAAPRIIGLQQGANKPSLSQSNFKASNSIAAARLRSQAKPRGKTLISTGKHLLT